MFNQYFGQYLLNNKKITALQLAEVMDHERATRVKLGVLAMNSNFMTAEQVEFVHQLQRIQDKRFGELAIEQGYLTIEQLDELLDNQNGRHLSLSQAIIDKQYLTLAELENVLASYKQENELSSEQCQALEKADFDQASKLFLDFTAAGEMGETYQTYIGLLQRNIVRFLDAEPVIGKSEPIADIADKWLICQKITGDIGFSAGLIMDDATLLKVACKYSGEELTEIDDLAKDSAAEFLNMVNGIFCVNESNEGMELDLEPQRVLHRQMPAFKTGYSIPIHVSFGKFDVIVAIER